MPERKYLTPGEVVARYGNLVTERTLANWRSRGDGPPYMKVGGRVMYPLHDLMDWEDMRTMARPRAVA